MVLLHTNISYVISYSTFYIVHHTLFVSRGCKNTTLVSLQGSRMFFRYKSLPSKSIRPVFSALNKFVWMFGKKRYKYAIYIPNVRVMLTATTVDRYYNNVPSTQCLCQEMFYIYSGGEKRI